MSENLDKKPGPGLKKPWVHENFEIGDFYYKRQKGFLLWGGVTLMIANLKNGYSLSVKNPEYIFPSFGWDWTEGTIYSLCYNFEDDKIKIDYSTPDIFEFDDLEEQEQGYTPEKATKIIWKFRGDFFELGEQFPKERERIQTIMGALEREVNKTKGLN